MSSALMNMNEAESPRPPIKTWSVAIDLLERPGNTERVHPGRCVVVRAEQDTGFYRHLQSAVRSQRKIVSPRNEAASWRALLKELR